jgi:hypothetical protein
MNGVGSVHVVFLGIPIAGLLSVFVVAALRSLLPIRLSFLQTHGTHPKVDEVGPSDIEVGELRIG